MTLKLINSALHWLIEVGDTKPTDPPVGSTVHYTDSGEVLIWNGAEWVDDLRMINAVNLAYKD